MNQHNANAWLINTGWSGGPYGVGNRMKLRYTRAMLNAALDGELDNVEYTTDERFGFEVPLECPGVPSEVLQPIQTWENPDSYDKTADNLAKMFIENFTKLPHFQRQLVTNIVLIKISLLKFTPGLFVTCTLNVVILFFYNILVSL